MPYRDAEPPEGWAPRRARRLPGADWNQANWPPSTIDVMKTGRKGDLLETYCVCPSCSSEIQEFILIGGAKLDKDDIGDLWYEPEPGVPGRLPHTFYTAKRYKIREVERRAWEIYGGPVGLAAKQQQRDERRARAQARNGGVPRGRGRGRGRGVGAGRGRGRNGVPVPQARLQNGQPAHLDAQAAPQAPARRRGQQIGLRNPAAAAPVAPALLMPVQAPAAAAAPVVRNAPRPNVRVPADIANDSDSDSDVEIVGQGPAPPTPSRSQKQARHHKRSDCNALAGPSRARIYAKEEVEVVGVSNVATGPSTPVKVKSQPRRDPRVGPSGLLTPPPTERSAGRVRSSNEVIEIESHSEAGSKMAKRRRIDAPATPTSKGKVNLLDVIDLSFD